MLFRSLTSKGGDRVVNQIDDALTRRVARISTGAFLHDVNRVAIGVMIFAGIAAVASLLTSWLRHTYFPPKPKMRRVKHVDLPPVPGQQ